MDPDRERRRVSLCVHKVDGLAEVLEIHPLALLTLSYVSKPGVPIATLIAKVTKKLDALENPNAT